MKSTQVTADGQVRCPVCGSTFFTEKRTGKAKWLTVPTIGIGVLLAPKRLKCGGCGINLKRNGRTLSVDPVDRMRADLARDRAAVEEAKRGAVGDPLPDNVHPRSLRARQIRKAREKAAEENPPA